MIHRTYLIDTTVDTLLSFGVLQSVLVEATEELPLLVLIGATVTFIHLFDGTDALPPDRSQFR